MNTVFSYIVQKRLSQENENVATEALAFILDSSERGRNGLMKLLRGIAPDLPDLRFRPQQTEGVARPDMWGLDGDTPRVFIENKFWAGLTENQPVEYLRLLTRYPSPAVLLVVVPAGQHHVENDQIERNGAGQVQRVVATSGDVDDETVFPESLGQKGRGLGFVFNDQNPHDGDRSIFAACHIETKRQPGAHARLCDCPEFLGR